MSENKLLAQRVGLVGLTSVFIGFSPIVLLSLLTKTLSVQEYGTWVMVMVTVDLIPQIATIGLQYSMIRFLAPMNKYEDLRKGFYTIVFLVLLTGTAAALILLSLSSITAASLFGNNIMVAQILPLIIFVTCLNITFITLFRTLQQIKRYSVIALAQAYLSIPIVAYFILSGKGISGAVLGFLLGQSVILLCMAFLTISEFGISTPRFADLKKYVYFGLPLVPSNLSYWIVNSSDRYIIGIFLGIAFVGYYSPSYSLGYSIALAVSPLAFILPPALSKLYDDNEIERVKTILEFSLKYFLALAIPLVVILSFFSQSILTILSTPDLAAHGYSVTPLIASSALLFGVYAIIVQIIILVKKPIITAVIWITAALFNVCITLILVPRIGIMGAAVATFLTFLFATTVTAYLCYRYLPFSIDTTFLLKSALASCAILAMFILWNPISVLGMASALAASAVIYIAILLVTHGIKKEEIKFFRGLLNIGS